MLIPEVRPSAETHNPLIALQLTEAQISECEAIFKAINGEELITKVVIGEDQKVDPVATAHKWLATIVYEPEKNYGANSTLDAREGRWVIAEHDWSSPEQRRFLIGHEIGHMAIFIHFLDRGQPALREYFREIKASREKFKLYEAFADYFALRLMGVQDGFIDINWDTLPDAYGIQDPWKTSESDLTLF